MSKKIGGVFGLVGLCALSMFLVNCGSSSSRPTGLLYVLTQGANGVGNNVSSFAIDLGSGALSFVNSNASTCTTSGVSCGPPLDIVLDTTGGAAFVLNQGVPSASVAPTIYSYTVNSDGSFGAPSNPPAATLALGDTSVAMTRDAADQFLFVIDIGSTLTPQNCPPPGTLDPGNPIYAGCPSISVFSTQSGSTTLNFVTQFSGAQTPLFLGRVPTALSTITFTPQGGGAAQEFLFVTSNSDPVLHNDNTLSVYSVSSAGVLAELVNSPYATSTDPISVLAANTNTATTNSGGVFVYVGSQPTASGALSIFQMCTVVGVGGCTQADVTNALLVPVTTPAPPATGQNPVGMVVDPTNSFLYVVCYGQSAVYGYHIENSTGVLTALSPANQQTGAQPVALAVHPSVNNTGQFLYTSNSGSTNISGFTLSTTSGSMSSPITVVSPSTPSGMVAR
jgi:Lactonase, 7-bladed beta-propeller